MARKALLLLALACMLAAVSANSRGESIRSTSKCHNKTDSTVVAAGTCVPEFYTCLGGEVNTAGGGSCGVQGGVQQVYNRKSKGCSAPGAIGTQNCQCGTFYGFGTDLALACKVCQKKNRPGNYAWPGVPKYDKYIVCGTDGPSIYSCNAGLVYCKKVDNCIEAAATC